MMARLWFGCEIVVGHQPPLVSKTAQLRQFAEIRSGNAKRDLLGRDSYKYCSKAS
jgi:hypothetical protein